MDTARTVRNAATGMVATIAAWSSYWHMVHVALHYGERVEVAYALPGSVDGMLVVASMVMVDDRRRALRIGWITRLAFTIGVLASVAANVAAAHPGLPARLVAAWPATALLLVVELLSHRPTAPGIASDTRRSDTASPAAPPPTVAVSVSPAAAPTLCTSTLTPVPWLDDSPPPPPSEADADRVNLIPANLGGTDPQPVDVNRAGPDRVGPDRVGPDRVGPDRVGPEQVDPSGVRIPAALVVGPRRPAGSGRPTRPARPGRPGRPSDGGRLTGEAADSAAARSGAVDAAQDNAGTTGGAGDMVAGDGGAGTARRGRGAGRPAAETRRLVGEYLSAEPALRQSELAERLGVSPRRLRKVLEAASAAPGSPQPAVDGAARRSA